MSSTYENDSSGKDENKKSNTDTQGSALEQELVDFVRRAGNSDMAKMPAYRAFKSQIEQYPVLSREAQNELFAQIEVGRDARAKLEELGVGGDAVRVRRLRKKIRDGESAMEYLVGSNLRLVLVIAGDLASQRFGDRAFTMLPDLVQEGNLGLMEATQKFDPSYGVPFYTFAANHIRQGVREALTQDKHIRVPTSWVRVSRIAAGVSSRLEAEMQRDPTLEEIRQGAYEYCMEWAYQRIPAEHEGNPEEGALSVLRKQGILSALNNLDKVLNITRHSGALDAPVGEEGGGTTVGDQIASPSQATGAFDEAELEELHESLMLALGGLKEREREIVLLRYGFKDGERWTYSKLGETFNVTAERIRQIEQKVLSRLASPTAQYVHLSSFLDSQIDSAIDQTSGEQNPNAATVARNRRRS